MVIKRTEDGLVATEPFLVTCGCGSVVPDARQLLIRAGVPHVPMVNSTGNSNVLHYLRTVGLTEQIRSLNKNRHAAIYNPKTGAYIDILDVHGSQEVLDNIYSVVTGE